MLKMPSQFALIAFSNFDDRRLLLRLLTQNGLPNNTLDVRIRKLDADGKSGLEPLQTGRGVQRGLTGAHQEQALVQLRAAMLRDFLQVHRALDLVTDELLNLVNNKQGAGKIAFLAKDLA